MKKNKLVGLATLFLALGMVGCGEKKVEPCEEHTWEYKLDETKHWQACSVCGEVKEGSEKAHEYNKKFDDQTGVTRATCMAAGQIRKACACGANGLVAEAKLNHQFEDLGADATGYLAATCGQDGNMPQKCKNCTTTNNKVLTATGEHTYGDPETVKEATCLEAGMSRKVCSTCQGVEETEIAQLAHTFADVQGSEVVADTENGYIGYKYIECPGCATKRLVWAPTETTAASKETLASDCSKFNGNPIGWKLKGEEKGAGNHEYDPDAAGDFYEFKFKSPITKKVTLGAMLTPSQYAASAEVGLWTVGPNVDSDWTPGYRPTQEDPTKGEVIDDWRYIVKVNDIVVAPKADYEDSIPTSRGEVWTNSPYSFDLVKDEVYTIRIIQAAGYESTFSQFGFEFLAPKAVKFNGEHAEWSALDYSSASEGIGSNDEPVVNGESKGIKFNNVYNVGTPGSQANSWTQTAPVLESDASEGDHVIYTINSEKAAKATLTMIINYKANSWDIDESLAALSMISNDGTKGYVWDGSAWTASPVRYKLFLNDTEVTIDPTIAGYTEPKMKNNADRGVELPCTLNLVEGENKIELQNYGGYGAIIVGFALDKYVQKTAVTSNNLENGDVELTWKSSDYNQDESQRMTSGTSTRNKVEDVGVGFVKFNLPKNSNGGDSGTPAYPGQPDNDKYRSYCTFYVDSPKASETTTLSFEALRDKPTISGDTWFGANKTADQSVGYVEDPENPGQYIVPDYRYLVRINDVVIPFSTKGEVMKNTATWVKFEIANFALKEGLNKIQIEAMGGYGVEIFNWKLTLVAPQAPQA